MAKKKRQNKYSLCQLVGLLLVISSVIYMGYSKSRVLYRKHVIEQKEEDFVKSLQTQESVPKEKSLQDTNENSVGDEQKLISEAIGYIKIDKINIILPIFQGTSKEVLREGVGILDETDYPTDEKNSVSVIAGHRGGYNGDQTFLNIDKLKENDEIKIITKEKELTYKVIRQEVIESTDWSKFTREKDKSKLILISCHPYPQNYQRLLIISELVNTKDLKDM